MLKDYIALYVDPTEPLILEGFRCLAEDADHAEEQTLDAYPNVEVVWVEQTDSVTEAADEYWYWRD